MSLITKPDTQLPQSRAGGQGLFFRSPYHFGRSSEAKDRNNPKKVKCDGQTYRQTDGPINQWTNGPMDGHRRGVESFSRRLKGRPIRYNIWIVEQMRYPTDQPTNRPTNGHTVIQSMDISVFVDMSAVWYITTP